jgi:flagellin-like protein
MVSSIIGSLLTFAMVVVATAFLCAAMLGLFVIWGPIALALMACNGARRLL